MGEFEQLELADSLTIEQRGAWKYLRKVMIGDSTCYHALHHWFAAIPDVHLARAHRALMEVLPESHPYKGTVQEGFFPAFGRMLRISRYLPRPS